MQIGYARQEHGHTVPPERGFRRGGGESLVLLIVEHCSAIFADFRPIGRAIERKARTLRRERSHKFVHIVVRRRTEFGKTWDVVRKQAADVCPLKAYVSAFTQTAGKLT